MQKKFKFLTIIVTTALVAALVIASAGPAIGSWIDHSITNITSGAATTSITTEVIGVATNANVNPIDINGKLYSMPGGAGAYSITQYDSGAIASDPASLISTATVSTSGWVPGDYALFQVTITNTGSTTLQFSEYTIVNYFTGPGTTYTFPAFEGYGPGPTVPVGTAPTVGALDSSGQGWQHSSIDNGWTSEGSTALMVSDFNTAITTDTYGLINTWGANNYLMGTAPTVGQTLVHGATFVYYIAIGLGVDTAPGIPNAIYTLDVPLTVAN